MFGNSWRIGRIFGVQVKVDPSWTLIACSSGTASSSSSADLVRIPAGTIVREAVDRYFMRMDHGAFPVEADDRTIGILTRRAVRRLDRDRWSAERVEDVMTPLDRQLCVDPGTPMDRVVRRLEDVEGGRVLVTRDDEVVGIITGRDITRWIVRYRMLKREPCRAA